MGKVEQRSRRDPWNPAPDIDREGQPVHASWTTYFIQNYVPKRYWRAALAGAYHHAPEKSPAADPSLSMLVSLADKLSAGERSSQDEEVKLPKQQVTIFDQVELFGEGRQAGWYYLPLKPLELKQESLFPGQEIDEEKTFDRYSEICNILHKAATQDIPEPEVYLENFLGAMQRATWCVPSAYYHSLPDVSLYDHSRMTAALAACMAGWTQGEVASLLEAIRENYLKGETTTRDPRLEKEVALLVGGDISGVQDFIYTLSSKGAAQTLRGRSFYLQLLTEAMLRYVLSALGLPITNVIYSGGGHFYLLAPVEAADKLPDIRQQITLKLLEHHGTSLYLAMGYTVVPASGFRIGVFPEHWSKMHRAVNEAKSRRYTELDEAMYYLVFDPPDEGGNPNNTCSVCGGDRCKVSDWDIEREEQNRICTQCKSYIEEIGKDLPDSLVLALGFGEAINTKAGKASDALKAFGMQFKLIKNAQETIELPGAERISLWALEDVGEENWPLSGSIPSSHSLRYVVNRVPRGTFDEIQKKVAGGFERLGVLRMDVDNLGDIFKYGLGKLATLSRLSTLSFQVSLYFEGWVKHLVESEDFEGLIYSVYSGGDDLFLIGPWDRIPKLADKIRKDFHEYTGGHPGLHVSAGMAFIDGKYPVYQAADDAGKMLQQAKELDGKNAFAFLGTVWRWDVFERVKEKQQQLERLVGRGGEETENLEGPQAILGILRKLAMDEADEVKERGRRPVWGRWMWMGAYQLKRMAERYEKTKPELSQAIEQIRRELCQNYYKEIYEWGAAARWTQLLIRKKRNERKVS